MTDEDLRRLKDYIFEISYCTCNDNGTLCEGCNLGKQFPALLSRLQVAEKFIRNPHERREFWSEDKWEDYNKWLKECGQ